MKRTCRERLLDAAETVAVREGGARITLDAVAAEADVSKGGLLYHFSTKEALLEAMVARHLNQAQARRAEAIGTVAEEADANLLAEVHAALTRTSTDNRIGSALLAAVANEPKLLESVAAFQRVRFGRLKEGASESEFARRALIVLATEGLVFLDLLGVAPFDDTERSALAVELLRMAGTYNEV